MTQLQKARKEIAINRLDETHPLHLCGTTGHRECTKGNPMPLGCEHASRWQHSKDSVHETDYQSDYSIEYKCDSCGYSWTSEMPE